MAHTPGPWMVEPVNTQYVVHFDGEIYHYIAEVNPLDPDEVLAVEADAHLISAAPDLLESLKVAATVMHACAADCAGTPNEKYFTDHAARFDAVVAKAEGR